MTKKRSSILIIIICLLLIVVLLSGLLIKNQLIVTENLIENLKSTPETLSSESSLTLSNKKNDSALRVLLKEGGAYSVPWFDEYHDKGECSYMYVKLDDLSISKERGDFDIVSDFFEHKDENGNLLDEYSYVVAKMRFKNLGERTFDTGVNRMCLIIGDEYLMYTLRAYNSGKSTSEEKDYFLFDFDPNVEYTFNLAFIVDDETLQHHSDNMYILASYEDSEAMNDLSTVMIVDGE